MDYPNILVCCDIYLHFLTVIWGLFLYILTVFAVSAICCRLATYPCTGYCCQLGKFSPFRLLKVSSDNCVFADIYIFFFGLIFWGVVGEQILKDGMQHVGKLICSNLGARMDSEPKRWRILGLYV